MYIYKDTHTHTHTLHKENKVKVPNNTGVIGVCQKVQTKCRKFKIVFM